MGRKGCSFSTIVDERSGEEDDPRGCNKDTISATVDPSGKPRPPGRRRDFEEFEKSEKVVMTEGVTTRTTPRRSLRTEKEMDAPREQRRTSGMKMERGGVEGNTMQSCSSVSSGFAYARGSMIRFSREAMEAVRKHVLTKRKKWMQKQRSIRTEDDLLKTVIRRDSTPPPRTKTWILIHIAIET